MHDDIEVKSNLEELVLYSDAYPFNLPLRIKTFENEADYTKFIKGIERMVRNSMEYRQWSNYIKDVLHVNSCALTEETLDQVGISIHHHPINLFTIVKGVINKKMESEEPFCTFDICIDVIELHFANKIGYIPLVETLHDKFHNGFLDLPISLVKGNYKSFLDNYSKYLDEDELEKIQSRMVINESNCNWSKDNYPGMNGAA